jgi:hypothetical protein
MHHTYRAFPRCDASDEKFSIANLPDDGPVPDVHTQFIDQYTKNASHD